MKMNLYGDIFNDTGYASHTRQLANALFKLNKETHLDCNKPADYIRHVNTAEMEMIHNPLYPHATDICINLPPYWSTLLAQKPHQFIGWCVWEGINVPKYWIQYLKDKRVTHIIVPSQHVKSAILNTESTLNNVVVIPHGVNTQLFKPAVNQSKTKFTFVANKGWAQGIFDRGGVQWLLKAFCEEFKDDTNVKLLLKINVAYCPPGWNLGQELANLGITPETAKNVEFVVNNIPYIDMPKLYHQGDVFVSPTMGDAFNIPCLEAMACGLPVITTNFGGQTDFVNEQNGWLIDYELVDCVDIMYEGNKWAKPNLEQLKKTMRYVYNNKEEVERKGFQASINAQSYTWQRSAEKLYDLIS